MLSFRRRFCYPAHEHARHGVHYNDGHQVAGEQHRGCGHQYASAFSEGSDNKAVNVDSEHVKLVGYSDLMLPVMEDMLYVVYNMRDLLTFSAVCGVGLDTVPPIPGDTSAEGLAGVYQEVATLAFRLNKPLFRCFLWRIRQWGM